MERKAAIRLSLAGDGALSRSLPTTLPHLGGEDTPLLHLCFFQPLTKSPRSWGVRGRHVITVPILQM